MNRTEEDLVLLFGLYLASQYLADQNRSAWQRYVDTMTAFQQGLMDAVDPALQFGATVYDATHSDEAHAQDLPGHPLTREAVLAIATRAGFPDPKLASAIAMAESGGDPAALVRSSREYSVGLWQINTLVHLYDPAELKDPTKNAAAAYKISKGGTDWRPWTTYTSGQYKHFQTGVLA